MGVFFPFTVLRSPIDRHDPAMILEYTTARIRAAISAMIIYDDPPQRRALSLASPYIRE
jgi:hypothetical protein